MNFDLNINNYKLSELEDIFELPHNYNEHIFDSKESKLRKNIMSNNNIQNDLKPKILAFIADAKGRIMAYFSKNTNNNSNNSNTNNNSNTDNNNSSNSNITISNNAPNPNAPFTNQDQPLNVNFNPLINPLLLHPPPTPYTHSKPSEFYAGTLNPLNNRVLTNQLNIDTRFRDNYYSTQASNFHLTLPMHFFQVVSIALSAIEFPSTFYPISSIFGNNFFVIVIGNVKQVITIPGGNYTPSVLETYLNEKMASYSTQLDPNLSIFQYIYFTIDFLNGCGSSKMIVSINDSYPNQEAFLFSLEFNTNIHGDEDKNTPLPLKLGWLFGFREGVYINNFNYVSEGIVDLQGIKYVYLVVNDFNNNVNDGFYGAFNASLLNKNILSRLSLSGNLFNNFQTNSLITQTFTQTYGTPRHYFGPVNIYKLQIQLLDEYGRIVDMNNMDFSFCLNVQTVYDL
jgi:hypothetical protein